MTDHSDEEALGRLRALGPLSNVETMQENVRRRLDAPEPRAAWFQGRPRKAVWAAGLTLAAGAVAATSFWGAGPSQSGKSASPAVQAAPPPRTPVAPSLEPATAPPSDSIQEVPPTAAEARKPSGAAPSASAPRPNLLYQAATALRHDNEPSRALRLLDQYVQASPAAAGSEEVQTLRMEAYYRLGSPRAAELARAYLKAFPQGRFRQTAQNIAKPSSPSSGTQTP